MQRLRFWQSASHSSFETRTPWRKQAEHLGRGQRPVCLPLRSMFNQKYLSYNLFLHAVQKQQVRSWQGILQISLLLGALGVGRNSPDTCVEQGVFFLAHAKLSSLRVGLDSIISSRSLMDMLKRPGLEATPQTCSLAFAATPLACVVSAPKNQAHDHARSRSNVSMKGEPTSGNSFFSGPALPDSLA